MRKGLRASFVEIMLRTPFARDVKSIRVYINPSKNAADVLVPYHHTIVWW